MNKDARNLGIVLIAFVGAALWLRKRKPATLTQTTVMLTGARSETGELNPAFTSDIKDRLNRSFDHVCNYDGASIFWPSLTDPCPPTLNGKALLSDNLIPRV